MRLEGMRVVEEVEVIQDHQSQEAKVSEALIRLA